MPGLLLDSNVWLAAAFPSHIHHAAAQATLLGATQTQPALFCRATEQSFLRLATTPHLIAQYGAVQITNATASAMLKSLLAKPHIGFSDEPPGTADLWHRLAACNTASPKVWMDAYLAAFAICGGLRLVTLDSDFHAYQTHQLDLFLLPAVPG